MNPDSFFEKWKSDIMCLEDAYVTIQHKKSSRLWFPICFFIMGAATIMLLLFISDVFQVRITYLILYALFAFYQIFMSMYNEYQDICTDEIAAYNTICLLHSLSPELLVEYTEFCKTNTLYNSHRSLGYISVTAELLRTYELKNF